MTFNVNRAISAEHTRYIMPLLYNKELYELSKLELAQIIQRGTELAKREKLSDVLLNKGCLTFSHGWAKNSGYQVAAVINAVLEANIDQILMLGVFHPYIQEQVEGVKLLKDGISVENHHLRGIWGLGLGGDNTTFKEDHCLYQFEYFLTNMCLLYGKKQPRIFKVFPCLIGPNLETTPNIKEIKDIASDSIILSTADFCHHGIGYGETPDQAKEANQKNLKEITSWVIKSFSLLEQEAYEEYIKYCFKVTKSDWYDTGIIFHHLNKGKKGYILDYTYSNFSKVYKTPPPTWVYSALSKWV